MTGGLQDGFRDGGAGAAGPRRGRGRRARVGAPGRPGGSRPDGAAAPSISGSRSGQAGPFRLQQLVLLELAAAVLLVGVGGSAPLALVPAAVVAVCLVLLAVVRRRGRSLPEWLGTARALRARRRRAASTPLPPGTEPGLAPAVECDPDPADVRRTTTGTGGRSACVGDGTFLTAVVQVEPDATALRAERGPQPLPLGAGAGRPGRGRHPAGVGADRAAHPARARAPPAPAVGGRQQLRARCRSRRARPPCASPGSR